jgi:hypothetical protein
MTNKTEQENEKIVVTLGAIPGVVGDVELDKGATVLDAAAAMTKFYPEIEWIELAHQKEVRVQGVKYSNRHEIPEGYAGNIFKTPLNNEEIIFILTEIAGNVGEFVLICSVNGRRYGLNTPSEIGVMLQKVVGIDLDKVASITVGDKAVHHSRLVGNGDIISVDMKVEVEIDGETTVNSVTEIRNIIKNLDDDSLIEVSGEVMKKLLG